MKCCTDNLVTIMSTIVATLIVEFIIWLVTKIYRRASMKRKKSKQKNRLKKLEDDIKKIKKYKVALRLKETGLIYQCGVVRCSNERLVLLKIRENLHGFNRILLQDLFTKDELLECSDEVSYDCWEESEFDFILDI